MNVNVGDMVMPVLSFIPGVGLKEMVEGHAGMVVSLDVGGGVATIRRFSERFVDDGLTYETRDLRLLTEEERAYARKFLTRKMGETGQMLAALTEEAAVTL